MSQLLPDCLNEIFEYLVYEIKTLHSCLLVNRLWCEVAVRILWREACAQYGTFVYSTLISFLPSESKEILYKNGIIISPSTSKPLVFNYVAFCKFLSTSYVDNGIEHLLRIQSQNLNDNKYTVTQEIYKLFMSQIPSLKMLSLDQHFTTQHVAFTSYPGAKDCLKDLAELHCSSGNPEFYYQLSKICHNIQKMNISLKVTPDLQFTSDGLSDLIAVQQNLKYLTIMDDPYYRLNLADFISSLTKLPNILIKLDLNGHSIPSSFIAKFTNLQELVLSFNNSRYDFKYFEKLLCVTFPRLQILKFVYAHPSYELLTKFIECNGKNLKEFYVQGDGDNSLNLAIANFCPNIRKLSTGFKYDELETLKLIFNSCQYLEGIKILNEKEALEVVVKHSPKSVYELTLQTSQSAKLLPEELESFLMSWTNRKPQKPLTIISYENDSEKGGIIHKYLDLGVIYKYVLLR